MQGIDKIWFETGIYRPPSEGGSCSLLLRITRNCPWNKCTFCGMYKGEKFSLRSREEIIGDIDSIAALCGEIRAISSELGHKEHINREVILDLINRNPSLNSCHGLVMIIDWLQSGARTAFLQDANSLIMAGDKLAHVLRHLRSTFPTIGRVTSYARAKTLARKAPEELIEIREAGLDRLHVGMETGDDGLLKRIKKGVTGEEHVTGGKKAKDAGFQLSEYWMPGLGGKETWESHAKNTAQVLNRINPDYIRSRPFFPTPGTPLHDEYAGGQLEMLSPRELLVELKLMIQELDVTSSVCFDHMGNYWRNLDGGLLFSQDYEGYKFPEEKPLLLNLINEGIEALEPG